MSNRPCALCCPHGYHNDCPRCLSTDPRDARIRELEAERTKTQDNAMLANALSDRDRLAAEVAGLHKDYAKVRELSQQRGLKLQEARRGMEDAIARAGNPDPLTACRLVIDTLKGALAALEASGAEPPPAAGSPGEALKGKRGNAEYRATIARRALEGIANPLGGRDPKERCRQTEAVAREALAAMDAFGALPPPAAGSPGEAVPEPPCTPVCAKQTHPVGEPCKVLAEHAALLKVAEAAERMIQRGFSCGKCDQDVLGASCVCAYPEDAQMPSIRSALADLRQAREGKERGDGQG